MTLLGQSHNALSFRLSLWVGSGGGWGGAVCHTTNLVWSRRQPGVVKHLDGITGTASASASEACQLTLLSVNSQTVSASQTGALCRSSPPLSWELLTLEAHTQDTVQAC